jgi:hypothetical protein
MMLLEMLSIGRSAKSLVPSLSNCAEAGKLKSTKVAINKCFMLQCRRF